MELGIWEFRVCKERWGPELELGIWEFRVCKEPPIGWAWGGCGWDEQGCPRGGGAQRIR